MAGVQLRRYRLPREDADQQRWLAWWREVVDLREAFGFRVVTAVLEHQTGIFTWIVAHDGDFADAEREMMASAQRAQVFSHQRPKMTVVETVFVDRIV